MDDKTAAPPSPASAPNPGRRRFLTAVTAAIGGLVGLIAAIPLVRAIFHPVGRKVVSSGEAPIDAMAADELEPGAPPVRVELIGDEVRDAWASADQSRLGAAWVQKGEDGQVTALSSVCPHLGCSINFDGEHFRCPCHKSAFAKSGEKLAGPSKRGLDPLPVSVEEGRVKISWKRFKTDIAERVEV